MTSSARLAVSGGLSLAASLLGNPEDPPVILLHGGGQTRNSWKGGAAAIAQAGYHVIALDARGHGESDWCPQQDYGLDALSSDVLAVLRQLDQPAVIVGASLGGMAAMIALGENPHLAARGLVLVDIAVTWDNAGRQRILDFMQGKPEGFASLDEVADAVAAYNPHRPRPRNPEGLRANLREVDGRFFWHWDPAFMKPENVARGNNRDRLAAAASAIRVPVLLVRGAMSDLVTPADVAHFRGLLPHARFAEVSSAGHMIAGDQNDPFIDAVLGFLGEI